MWNIPGKTCEIRTIFFNWPVDGVGLDMCVKEQTNFRDLSVEDFGLKPTDTDAHVPQFFMVSKVNKEQSRSQAAYLTGVPVEERPITTRALHTQSAGAKARQRDRKKERRRWRK